MTHSAYTGPVHKDIQGLRAIAITLVVLAHASVPGFAGGFVGVDVFFVLSGYLITGLLVRERLNTGRIHYGQFLARRLRRLLPAMTVMLVFVILLSIALLTKYELRMQAGSFAYAATWTSNFFFALSHFDYFAALEGKDLFLHTWSLGVEEQFYLVWPWFVAFAFMFPRNGATAQDWRIWTITLLAAIFIFSLGLCLHWSSYEPLLGFYMMPARGWQFALGGAVFIGLQKFEGRIANQTIIASRAGIYSVLNAIGMVLVIGSAILLNAELAYPGYFALFPSVGAALIILAGRTSQSTMPSRLISSAIFVWIGDRSYSLYLWHWPVLLLGDAFGVSRTPAGLALLIALSILLASLSYQFVELPFWKGRLSRNAPLSTIVVSLVVIIAAVGGERGFQEFVYGEAQITVVQGAFSARRDVPSLYDVGRNCDTYYHSAEVEPCFEGPENANHTAVLFGDSIGAQWVSLIEEIYKRPEWRLVVLTKSACPIVDEDYHYAPVGGNYDVCSIWRDGAIRYLSTINPDIVFIGSSSHYEFTPSQWTNGFARVLEALHDKAKRLIVIPGTPELSFDGPTCIESPYRFSFQLADSRRECEEGITSNKPEDVAGYLELASVDFENVRVMNLNELVCPDRRCAAQNANGITVFRDRRHLTETFVRKQAPAVLGQLEKIQAGPTFLKESATLASDR